MAPRASALLDAARRRLRPVSGVVSPVGLVVFALGVCSWYAAVRWGWVEAAWIAVACLTAAVLSVLFLVGRSDVTAEMILDQQRVTVGDAAGGRIVVRNAGTRRMLPLQVELVVGGRTAAFAVPTIAAGAEHSEEFVLPTQRRRIVPVGPVNTVRGDPLGMLRRSVQWGSTIPLYVHPRIVRLEQLGAGFLRDLEGQPTTDLSNTDLAFHALREYTPGDDRRFVHWRTTARVGQLMIRQFVDTRRSHLGVVLDTAPDAYANREEFELAVSLAGSVAVRALRDEQRVTLVTGSGVVHAPNGRALLDALAGVERRRSDTDLVACAAHLSTAASGVSIVALITGSKRRIEDVQQAARRAGEGVRCLAIRATPGEGTSARPVGAVTLLSVGKIDEFAFALWAVTQW